MLKCETNTKDIEREIEDAAVELFLFNDKEFDVKGRINLVFEFGQWYINFYDNIEDRERIYAVSDASQDGKDYFDFEEINFKLK